MLKFKSKGTIYDIICHKRFPKGVSHYIPLKLWKNNHSSSLIALIVHNSHLTHSWPFCVWLFTEQQWRKVWPFELRHPVTLYSGTSLWIWVQMEPSLLFVRGRLPYLGKGKSVLLMPAFVCFLCCRWESHVLFEKHSTDPKGFFFFMPCWLPVSLAVKNWHYCNVYSAKHISTWLCTCGVKDKPSVQYKPDSSLLQRRTVLCPGRTSLILSKHRLLAGVQVNLPLVNRYYFLSLHPLFLCAFLHIYAWWVSMYFLYAVKHDFKSNKHRSVGGGHFSNTCRLDWSNSALGASKTYLTCLLTSLNGATPFPNKQLISDVPSVPPEITGNLSLLCFSRWFLTLLPQLYPHHKKPCVI